MNAEFQRIAMRDKKMWKNLENAAGATGLEKSIFIAIPKKNKCKKAKWLSEETLQIAVKKTEGKQKAKEKWKDINICMQNSKE